MSAQPKNRTTERAEAIHLWARHKQEVLLQESDRYTGLAKDAALKAVLRGDDEAAQLAHQHTARAEAFKNAAAIAAQ